MGLEGMPTLVMMMMIMMMMIMVVVVVVVVGTLRQLRAIGRRRGTTNDDPAFQIQTQTQTQTT